MDLDLLRTFVAICDTGSFTAAARHVGRTQSAVSLQVRRLEQSLGRPLFMRGAPGTVLTEHGALLLPNARRILGAVADTLVSFSRATEEGVFLVGLPDDYAPRILDPVLRAFGRLYPSATIDVVIDESRTLVKRLAEGAIDLAFVTEEEGPMQGGPVAFTDAMVWAAPRDGEIHLRDPLPIALWVGQDSYGVYMRERLAELGRPYRVAVVSRSMTGLRGAVSAGLAVSAMMRSSLGPQMRELTMEEGFGPLARLNIHLETAHLKISPAIEALVEVLLDAVAETPKDPPRRM